MEPQLAAEWLRELEGRGDEATIDWLELYRSWAEDLAVAQDAGVLLLAGSDAGAAYVFPAFDLHEELYRLVQHGGLSTAQALRTATSNPAAYFDMADRFGAVAPGMTADLVLLEENPLADVRNTRLVAGVLMGGEYFDTEALQRLLRSVRQQVTSAARPVSGIFSCHQCAFLAIEPVQQ